MEGQPRHTDKEIEWKQGDELSDSASPTSLVGILWMNTTEARRQGCCVHHIHLLGCSAMVRSGRREARANRHAQITDEQAYHIKVFALGFRGNSRRGKEMASEDKRKC